MSAKGKKTPKAVEHNWTLTLHGSPIMPDMTIAAATVEHKDHVTVLRNGAGDVVFASPLVRYVRREPDALTLDLPEACAAMSPFARRALTEALRKLPGMAGLTVVTPPPGLGHPAEAVQPDAGHRK